MGKEGYKGYIGDIAMKKIAAYIGITVFMIAAMYFASALALYLMPLIFTDFEPFENVWISSIKVTIIAAVLQAVYYSCKWLWKRRKRRYSND
jgi:chromate transport protein ChrA